MPVSSKPDLIDRLGSTGNIAYKNLQGLGDLGSVRAITVWAIMATFKTVYKCCKCGATSYQRVIERASNGALLPTGEYRCTGCRNVFATLRAWWQPRYLPELRAESRFG